MCVGKEYLGLRVISLLIQGSNSLTLAKYEALFAPNLALKIFATHLTELTSSRFYKHHRGLELRSIGLIYTCATRVKTGKYELQFHG